MLYWGNSYIIREVKQHKRTEIRMEWSNVTRKLSELKPWERNPRLIKEDQAKRLEESFDNFGQVETIAIGPDNEVYNEAIRLLSFLDNFSSIPPQYVPDQSLLREFIGESAFPY